MHHIKHFYLLLLAAAMAFTLQTAHAASNGALSQLLATPNLNIEGEPVKTAALSAFYRGRGNTLAWASQQGLSPQADRALEVLAASEDDGLNPKDYAVEIIDRLKNAGDSTSQAKVDILISHAILRYASDLRYGRDSPEREESYGGRPNQPVSADLLTQITRSKPDNVAALLAKYTPPRSEYAALKNALQRYRAIERSGGLPQLNFYRLLQLHNNVPAVQTLRTILVSTGDLKRDTGTEIFDEDVDQAVRQFQIRHGIEADGVVGRETRQELNTPAQTRIRSLIASMERLRWLPDSFGTKYVILNLPGYSLRAVRPGSEDLKMKIIVGKTARQSPTFIRSISQVIFNPPWTVPPRIAAEDILPDIKKQSDFFTVNDFKLLRYTSGGKTAEVDPRTINWNTVTQSNFQWTLYQPPGTYNPLGRVKFYIPNTPQVYMHDTPRKTLFSDADRNLSSGCIRLELPKAFANYVLTGESGWNTEKVYKTFDTTKNTIYVPVRNQPKLYFLYLTSTVDENGLVHFHDDIYGRDSALLKRFGQE